MRRQGKFTIADLMGIAVLTLSLAAFWAPMTDAMSEALSGANVLSGAAIVIIIPTIIFAVLAQILVRSGPNEQAAPPQRQARGRRR